MLGPEVDVNWLSNVTRKETWNANSDFKRYYRMINEDYGIPAADTAETDVAFDHRFAQEAH